MVTVTVGIVWDKTAVNPHGNTTAVHKKWINFFNFIFYLTALRISVSYVAIFTKSGLYL